MGRVFTFTSPGGRSTVFCIFSIFFPLLGQQQRL